MSKQPDRKFRQSAYTLSVGLKIGGPWANQTCTEREDYIGGL